MPNIQDPSEIGVDGLTGLDGLSENTRKEFLSLYPDGIKPKLDINSYKQEKELYSRTTPITEYVGDTPGLGESRLDKQITLPSQLENLEQTRAELEPWYDKLLNGTAKMGVTFSTATISGTAGVAAGIASVISGGNFANNPVNLAMNEINKWSEEQFRNYRTQYEIDHPWKTALNLTSIADNIMPSIGFMASAALTGSWAAKGISYLGRFNTARKAFTGLLGEVGTFSGETAKTGADVIRMASSGDLILDATQNINKLAKAANHLKFESPVRQLVGGLFGALGEGSIEAVGNSDDWYNTEKLNVDMYMPQYQKQLESQLYETNPELFDVKQTIAGDNTSLALVPNEQANEYIQGQVDTKYQEAMKKLELDKNKVANRILLTNLPILTLSNAVQFGRAYAGGFKANKLSKSILESVTEDGKLSYGLIKKTIPGKLLKSVKNIASEGNEEMLQASAALGAGYQFGSELNSFFGAKVDPRSEEDVLNYANAFADGIMDTYTSTSGLLEGFYGGLIGGLGLPSFRHYKSAEGKLQSPISFPESPMALYREQSKEDTETQKVIDEVNTRVQDPKFVAYYQHLVRDNSLEKKKADALENKDEFEFKNQEDSQIINDVLLFNKIGRLDDLISSIEGAANIKVEDVLSDNGLLYLSEDGQTKTSIFSPTLKTPEEVVDYVKKNSQDNIKKINTYKSISDNLKIQIGNIFKEDELEELTWMMASTDDVEKRFTTLHTEIRNKLKDVATSFKDKVFKDDEGNEFNFEEILNLPPAYLLNALNEDNGLLRSVINKLSKGGAVVSDINDLTTKIKDLGRLSDRRIDFITKYNGYLKNPNQLRLQLEMTKELVKEGIKVKQTKESVNTLNNTDTQDEFEGVWEGLSEESKQQIEKNSKLLSGNGAIFFARKSAQRTLLNSFGQEEDENEIASSLSTMLSTRFETQEGKTELEILSELINSATFEDYGLPMGLILGNGINITQEEFERAKLLLQNKINALLEKEIANKDISAEVKPSPITGENSAPVESNIPVEEAIEEKEDLSQDNSQQNSKNIEKEELRNPTWTSAFSDIWDKEKWNMIVKEVGDKYRNSVIYQYLIKNKAFESVNNAEIKVGDEVRFMIDPELNKDHAAEEDKNGVTKRTNNILMVSGNQIFGVLREGTAEDDPNNVALRARVLKEFSERDPKETGVFYSKENTTVQRIGSGIINLKNNAATNLSTLIKEDEAKNWYFGINNNGTIEVNNRPEGVEFKNPTNRTRKRYGSTYIFIKNSDGTMIPYLVKRVTFNKDSFDMGVTSEKNLIANDIREILKSGIKAIEESALLSLKKELGNILFINDNFRIYFDKNQGNGFYTFKDKTNDKSKIDIYINNTSGERKTDDELIKEFVDALQSFNFYFRTNKDLLNKGNYNQKLISSGILTIDALSLKTRGGTVYVNPINSNGNEVKEPVVVKPVSDVNPIGGLETTETDNVIVNIKILNQDYSKLASGRFVKKGTNEEITDKELLERLSRLAWTRQTLAENLSKGTQEEFKKNHQVSLSLGEDREMTMFVHSGEVWDIGGNLQTGSIKERVLNIIKERQIITTPIIENTQTQPTQPNSNSLVDSGGLVGSLKGKSKKAESKVDKQGSQKEETNVKETLEKITKRLEIFDEIELLDGTKLTKEEWDKLSTEQKNKMAECY